MLYRLEIENFFSVRDPQILDLTIAPNVTDSGERYAPLYPGSLLRAPKVIAFYGPNASGKTTLLKALNFIMGFVRDSAQHSGPGFPCERFNDEESKSRPMRFAIEFGGIMDLTPDVRERATRGEAVEYGLYRYELCLNVEDGNPTSVQLEALRQKPGARGKWQRVFERDAEGQVLGSKSFPLAGYRHLLNTLQPNVSVLASFGMFQHPTAQIFVEAASGVLSVIEWTGKDQDLINLLAAQPEVVSQLNRDLPRIDIGVQEMRIVPMAQGPVAFFKHEGLDVEMPWALESHGTRAFIRLFPVLTTTLARGGIAIVDEFDTLLHALILPEVLRWFYANRQRNQLDAQLWLSCHSASLLDDLTKEEIVLCEKDHQGRTKFYSLMDVKAVRRDDNLYRKYLSGAYGAVPQIG